MLKSAPAQPTTTWLTRSGLALGLLSAALLSGCGSVQQPAGQAAVTVPAVTGPAVTVPAPKPVASALGRVYEIHFQGVGGSKPSVSLQRLSAGIKAQALVDAPDSLPATLIGLDTFAVGGTRHVRAVYKLTNNTAQTIQHLSFVPINTDPDGSAAAPASAPTVGSTYFNSVTDFGGTAVPDALVSSLTPVTGKVFSAASGTVSTDLEATPYAAIAGTAGLHPAAPSGLVVNGVAGSGWRSVTSLAPGASTNITFAVDFPTNSPKTDPFSFSVVVTTADDQAPLNYTPVHEIQGGGPASPKAGQTLTTQGVVTANFQDAGQLKGFFIQSPDADADTDAATSEGVFVYCPACAVKVGDLVRVTGPVSEFNTVTQINPATGGVTVVASGIALPAPITVTLPVSDWEPLEGMRVRVQGVVTENYKLGRGNTVKVADTRLTQFTQLSAPSVAGYAAHKADIAKRTISIDDASTAQNVAALYGRDNKPLSAANTLRTGDNADVVGVVHYGFDYSGQPDTYRIETTLADATFTGPVRPPAPTVSGNLTVASANVLNFWTTLGNNRGDNTIDDSNSGCTDGGTDAAGRGANNCTEYLRQLDKVVSNLAGLNADVTGLMEVENNAAEGKGGDALRDLVSALNAKMGAGTYAAVSNPNPGTDFIQVALIYKPSKVSLVGAALNDTDPVNDRYPLAQVFQAANGTQFAVVVNHMKSKGSGSGANADQNDGQGGSAARREQQVPRLLDLIQNQIVIGRGVQNVIAVGDFNAYDQETSLVNLRKGLDGLANTGDDLFNVFDSSVYSYQFDGQFGSLDHAFVTQSMKALLSGDSAKWHDNTDEPDILDYNLDFKSADQITNLYNDSAYRSSDHDPLKVGFNLPATTNPAPTVSLSGAATATTNTAYTLDLTSSGAQSANVTWGDGQTDSDVAITNNALSLTHTYTTASTPTISVTVSRSSDAQTVTASKSLTVAAPSTGGGSAVNHLVISQVYGGGGNTGAQYTNDFVELFNPTNASITLTGYKVEYFSGSASAGSGGSVTLNGSLGAGKYFLIQGAAGAATSAPLPTPDETTFGANISASTGRIDLTLNSSLVDRVGFGAGVGVQSEGSAAPAPANTKSVQRKAAGCTDTDNNSADFTADAPAPRNSASPATTCP
ncbi:ExeM/NucH family extracellular endonuclease [Deinococcus detaillensis]|uniref:ExeM/NucH family extracellular endonuclease n=1 Tax=Deinococcus detaillensis TaxID=2592048 RepID=A0A553V4R5_9DEIO|nr:ExeM/NucH family extracellular endonuclease [Deinococcus detaillensis]TSA87446.1 ExeM/NucH family extracellular endonuclease [Deinococcus detaillensis]